MQQKFNNTIWTHARYEVILLLRSWFFRIFSIAAIALLTIYNIVMFTNLAPTPWALKAFSSFVPYLTVLFLNIGQILLIIFLSADTFRRERQINSSEVTLIRSTTNSGFVTGKVLGVVGVMIALDIVVLLIAMILQAAIGASSLKIIPYFIYPLLIALPATVFSIGLTFVLVRHLRSQAISFVIMLGLMAISLFYLGDKFSGLFDVTGYYLPLIYSDFIGISKINNLILQRMIYLFLGLGFVLLAGYSYERLPQSRPVRSLSFILGVAFCFLGLASGIYYGHLAGGSAKSRAVFIQVNRQWENSEPVLIQKCNIFLEHLDNKFQAKAELQFETKADRENVKYFFSLNPGLRVKMIRQNDQPVEFRRHHHIVEIIDSGPLSALTIEYGGSIDESVCFAGITDEQHESLFAIFNLYKSDKRYAFLEKTFALLPPNALWYPVAGLPPGAVFPEKFNRNLVEYSLDIRHDPALTAIAPGRAGERESGKTVYEIEKPTPSLSLVIGEYKTMSIEVDSIRYALHFHPDHDFFMENFTEISDTLSYVIKDLMNDFERRIGLDYPFSNLHLVEVPVQYFTFNELHTVRSGRVHPEQIWLAEKGILYSSLDFAMNKRRRERFGQNEAMGDRETQLLNLRSFVYQTFMERGRRWGFIGNLVDEQPGCNVMPLFYSYTFNINPGKSPLLGNALEAYMLKKVTGVPGMPSFFQEGLSDAENAIHTYGGMSLADALKGSLDNEELPAFLNLKGEYLMNLIQSYTDVETFDLGIQNLVTSNRFKSIEPEAIKSLWQNNMYVNTDSLLADWYEADGLAGFLIKDVEMYKTLYKNRLRYQVKFKAANTQSNLGIINIRFRFGGRQAFMAGEIQEEEPDHIIRMEGNSARDVGIVLDSEPRGVNIDGVVALNIPLSKNIRFRDAPIHENREPVNSVTSIPLFHQYGKNEIIVDNEDSGFEVINMEEASPIMKFVRGDEPVGQNDFSRFSYWRPPGKWSRIKGDNYYGEYILSASYIRRGDGSNRVSWSGQLEQSGNYTVYTYQQDPKTMFGRRSRDDVLLDLEYIVYHDDGEESIVVDAGKAESGWVELGNFYFSKGLAKVELTDRTKGRLVVADAVKWVKD